MAKVQITESRLTQLIQESMAEVLQEAQEDEGLGKALGNAYQWTRNKFNNFKKDFNAGRNNQRWKNKNYDAFSGYTNADQIRNFNGKNYGNYVGQLSADRRENADNYWDTPTGSRINNGENPTFKRGPQINPNTTTHTSTQTQTVQNPKAQVLANKLQEWGFQLVNGTWLYHGRPQDKAEESQDARIRNAANRYYQYINGTLSEARKRRMNKIISESIQQAAKELLNDK